LFQVVGHDDQVIDLCFHGEGPYHQLASPPPLPENRL